MIHQTFSLEVPPNLVEEIIAQAKAAGADTSEPTPIASPADALDSPVSGDEIKQILELVILGFKSATAALAFLSALRATLKSSPKEAVIANTTPPRPKPVKITHETSDADLQRLVGL